MKKHRSCSAIGLSLVLLLFLIHENTALSYTCLSPSHQIEPRGNFPPATVDIAVGECSNGSGFTYTNASSFNVTDQGKFTNSGVFVNVGTPGPVGTISNGAKFTNENELQNLGVLRNESEGTFKNSGTLENHRDGWLINNGNFSNTGVITNAFAGTSTAVNHFLNNGTFTNEGQLDNRSTINNDGTLINKGELNLLKSDFSVLFNEGKLINEGKVQIERGSLLNGAFGGSYQQIASATGAQPQTIVNGGTAGSMDIQAGILSGTGAINGTLTNSGGSVQPGSEHPGTLTVFGDYTQGVNGRLDLQIGGSGQGSYDVLKVSGPVSLHGSLFVSLIDGFVPKVDDKFNLITGSSFDVGVRQISLPRLLAGMDWLTSFAGGAYNLTVRQVVVGAPEPSSLLLSGFGFAWLVGWGWRKQQNRKATN